jgi:hypothetical protein
VATRYQRLFFIPRGGMPQGQGEMPEEQAGVTPNENSGQEQGETPEFTAWLEAQPDQVKTLVGGKIQRLHDDLHTTRQRNREFSEQNKQFSEQLKALLPKAEKGSELEQALGETSKRLEQAERRAAFAEEASKPEIGCSNPRAAFLVAEAEGLFTKRGDPDWAAIKASAPELFGRKTPTPPGHAGNGNQAPPTPAAGMNAYIRQAAGRG